MGRIVLRRSKCKRGDIELHVIARVAKRLLDETNRIPPITSLLTGQERGARGVVNSRMTSTISGL